MQDFKNKEFREPEQLSLFVNLDGFEGPIDLLLTLAKEQKVDLSKISVLPLAEQYINFIENAKKLNIEIAADYLVIAAWLVYLKSKLILPSSDEHDFEDIEEMSDALKFRMAQLESMQNVSKKLFNLPLLGVDRFSRGQEQLFKENVSIEWRSSFYSLIKVYSEITYEKEENFLTITESKLFSIQEATLRLKGLLPNLDNWTDLKSFLPDNLIDDLTYKSYLAAHFSASLELSKDGFVSIKQASNYAPIFIKKNDKKL